mmetsp:Transcript_917/g.1991  ORF Transcript_917/g.1991 Transcript_917/m.1991 type:complete len:305 (+) Transcript_917:60-974(+)|eukprot:CAMPEP_0114462642 /NCGR_PEP_ID=MMETSP0104-20121206/6935_1 /TAXON_ID=37642 ORGANISM="Paraphysomonas imperforata, Strain PA2" /NCGR_SAMPLE_ID=MMETSP0104 /ASSEMBLY_ACC=CAM_ASM_000202 /LENGTH=304 /DNA_ID=CAMNT_0001635529 /DNA_START=25 /DNA_END=939 /DNA_ORIENTATION=+
MRSLKASPDYSKGMAESASSHNYITSLPDDMLFDILTYSGVYGSVNVESTCKSLQTVANNDFVWNHHLKRRHPSLTQDVAFSRSPPILRNQLNTGAERRWADAVTTLKSIPFTAPLTSKQIYAQLHQEQAELAIPLHKMTVYDGTTFKGRVEHRPIGCCLEYRGRLCPPDEVDICGHSVGGYHCAVEGCGAAYCNGCANGMSLVASMSTTTKISNACCAVCGIYCCYRHRKLMITTPTRRGNLISSTLCVDCFNDRNVDGRIGSGGDSSIDSDSESDDSYSSGYSDDDGGQDIDDDECDDDYSD